MLGRILSRLYRDSKFVMPLAVGLGAFLGFVYKIDEERRIQLAEFEEMMAFREELNVREIAGLKQDGQYINLLNLQEKVELKDSENNIIATEVDLQRGIGFLIVGSLDDGAFMVKFYKLKSFLEKQKAHHRERLSGQVDKSNRLTVDRATEDLISYRLFPIVVTQYQVQLKQSAVAAAATPFLFTDQETFENFSSVFDKNEAYIIGEQKSVALRLDLSLPFEDLQLQIVGFNILQGAYIARREALKEELARSEE